MGQQRKQFSYFIVAAVLLFAVGYFLLTFNRTLNTSDEGYLLYNFEKTAMGQVPHRDFYDDYGPASYWVGGALFNLFGTKLIVIRVFVLMLKTAIAVLIFLIARKLLPTLPSLAASLLFVVSWGDPLLPAINIFYAGYVGHFFALLGILLIILYMESDKRLWLVGTSVCLGISLLFKFQSAIIDLIGFSVFLSLKEQAKGLFAESGEMPDGGANPILIRGMRGGKCVGVLSVILFYLALFAKDHLDLYYFFIYLLSFYSFLGLVLLSDLKGFGRDKSDFRSQRNLQKCYREILTLLIGPAVFFALEIVYYYKVHGLEPFIYDTFRLPLSMNFYKPMADVQVHTALIASAAGLILIMMAVGNRALRSNAAIRVSFWLISSVLLLLIPTVLAFKGTSYTLWHLRQAHILPPVTLLLTAYVLISTWRKEQFAGMNTKDSLLVGLIFVFACQSFLMSYPRTDETHIQLNSTTLFILISFLLWKLYRGWENLLPGRRKALAGAFAALCFAVLTIPYLWIMKIFYIFTPIIPDVDAPRMGDYCRRYRAGEGLMTSYPMLSFDSPRSEGLVLPLWLNPPLHDFIITDIHQVMHYLRDNMRGNEKILVLCELQIMYFFASVDSCLQKEDYFVFLATNDLIDKNVSVRLTDDQLLWTIMEQKPRFIVRTRMGEHTKRIAAVWPKTYDFVKRYYGSARVYGFYEVLQPR